MLLSSDSILKEKIQLLEKKPSEILVSTFGVDPDTAQEIERVAGKLSVWAIDSYLNDAKALNRDQIKDLESKPKKEVMQLVSSSRMARDIFAKMPAIKDWLAGKQREGNPVNIKSYTSLNKAYEEAGAWHESLQAEDEVDFEYEGEEIVEYEEEKGVTYYWEDLQTNNSELESERMGHCGRSDKATTLLSLRSRRYIPETRRTLSSSHVTIALNENSGITYQIKGKNNSKPKEEYHPYIVDLLIRRKDIKDFGTEYEPKNDFKISDLSPELAKLLSSKRKDLLKGVYLQMIEIITNPKSSVTKVVNFINKNQVAIRKDVVTLKSLVAYIKGKQSTSKLSKKASEVLAKALQDLKTLTLTLDGDDIANSLFTRESRDIVRKFIHDYWSLDDWGWSEHMRFLDLYEDYDDMIYDFVIRLFETYPWAVKLFKQELDIHNIDTSDVYGLVISEPLFKDIVNLYYTAYNEASNYSYSKAYTSKIISDIKEVESVTSANPFDNKVLITIDMDLVGDVSESLEGKDSRIWEAILEPDVDSYELIEFNPPDSQGADPSDIEDYVIENLPEKLAEILEAVKAEKYRNQPNLPGLETN